MLLTEFFKLDKEGVNKYLKSLGGWEKIWKEYFNSFSSKIFGKVFGAKGYNMATIDAFSETLQITGLKHGRIIKKRRFRGRIDAAALVYDGASHPLIAFGIKVSNEDSPVDETIQLRLCIDLDEMTYEVDKFRIVSASLLEEHWPEIEKLEDGLQ